MWVHQHKGELDREQKIAHVKDLAAFGVFSGRQISVLTGLRGPDVHEIIGKSSHAGGSLNPDALPKLIEILERLDAGAPPKALIKETMADGISATMIARLTGEPISNITRWARSVG